MIFTEVMMAMTTINVVLSSLTGNRDRFMDMTVGTVVVVHRMRYCF